MAQVRLDRLIEYWDPQLKSAFLSAIKDIRNTSQIDQITQAVVRGDVEAAISAVNLNPANFRILDKAFAGAFEAGGNATASSFPTLGPVGGLRVNFQFNIRNPLAEDWLSNYTGQLISDILTDQRNMIQSVLTSAMDQGTNPRTAALDLVGRINAQGNREGGFIGLTNSQQDWVQGYADDLINDPQLVLPHDFNGVRVPGRQLRDRRFDDTVRRYIDSGEDIPQDKLDTMVASYKNRALLYRAQTISRSETITALHESQQNAMEQAVAEGLIDPDSVTFVWRTARDKRVRESHAEMDGQEVKMGEKFITGTGVELEYPGDPNGPASEIINCRCWRETKIDFLAGVE